MNKKTWKPYAAIVLILLYGVDIFWLSGFCVYYFGEWGIPMYEGLLADVDRNPSDHDDSDIDPALCISGADEWGYRKCE